MAVTRTGKRAHTPRRDAPPYFFANRKMRHDRWPWQVPALLDDRLGSARR
jgi:hypothetical protein